MPRNSGLERFNYLVKSYFDVPFNLVEVKGENIPLLVDRNGGYGWTGNDLLTDYNSQSLRRLEFVPWPEQDKPRLCLLGPQENTLSDYLDDKIIVAVPSKYSNLSRNFLTAFNTGIYFWRVKLRNKFA